ncbi:uncharacterized protein LOC125315422 [Rhodamnia argentea]|uniref:Uncharacterized protein LOC125315422 n=1 Tax=Rhodamnia argentea TaxID=178133 RepID=A0ABM3HHZ0_9MYRT|nr:uncharacterized protein LOC125315422 [Rhodamnia argentea]XP_048136233.1 uncharacterized protein LOC125315422 [Rhodamnia argentea]
MSFRGSLCFWLLLLLLLQDSPTLCWGRRTVSLDIASEYEDEWVVEGRSLKVTVNDYGGPSANRGHDPPTPPKKVGNNGNRGGGRRG